MISNYGILLRLVEEFDAEFILNLRTNPKLRTYISYTNTNILNQIKWIQNYKAKEMLGQEYYYIAQDQDGNRYGTIRLYDFDNKSFVLGSWIFLPTSPLGMAAKAHFMGLEIGFKMLKADYCRIRVRKDNIGVVRYIESFKAKLTFQDDMDLYFILSKETFYDHKQAMPYFLRTIKD